MSFGSDNAFWSASNFVTYTNPITFCKHNHNKKNASPESRNIKTVLLLIWSGSGGWSHPFSGTSRGAV